MYRDASDYIIELNPDRRRVVMKPLVMNIAEIGLRVKDLPEW
jgi:hypothetical protein